MCARPSTLQATPGNRPSHSPVSLALGLLFLLAGCQALPLSLSSARPEPAELPDSPPIAWGYSQDYPLPMASILESLNYLDRLQTPDGRPVPYRRLGALKRPSSLPPPEPTTRLERLRAWLGLAKAPGHILDLYELRVPGGTVNLWLDPYAGYTTPYPPAGFRLGPKANE